MWPGAYCIPYEEHIVLLLNESLFQRKSSLDFHHELMYFIRDGLLLVGISRPFSNIAQVENIYAGYLQAQYALEQGRILNPTNWCHSFEHYALHYLVKNGSEPFHPEQICHPAILKLIKHDEQHETSFTRTILAYIKCRYNAVAAAKSLYIHRSSFINRMERIKELIFIDWDDTDERLYLFLSFKILEMF
jgi:DNA-binding PucR family transcriptional regulator